MRLRTGALLVALAAALAALLAAGRGARAEEAAGATFIRVANRT